MAINLSKGGRINLSKEAPSLSKVGVGLGWDINATDTGSAFDVDASVFMLGASGKIPSDRYFLFYNNKKSPDDSTEHLGDNLTGAGQGDDETINIDLGSVNPEVQELVFVVTIHEAEQRRQNFGQIRNAFIRIYNRDNNAEIAKYDLDEDFSVETAIEFGRLYKKENSWRFQAVGAGFASGLQGFVDKYAG